MSFVRLLIATATACGAHDLFKVYIDVMIYINGGRVLYLTILPVFDNK